MNKQELIDLKQSVECLAAGVDPQSKLSFGEDCILNSRYNRNILNKVSSVLNYIINVGMVPAVDSRKKFDFYLTKKQLEMIEISDEPISISKFVFIVNQHIDTTKMKKLKATEITAWLVQNGYLTCVIDNEHDLSYKAATEKSKEIGIICEQKVNGYGNKYFVNLYSKKAQIFILNNLELITQTNPVELPLD